MRVITIKFISVLLSLLCVIETSAQVSRSFEGDSVENAEPSRREIIPYNITRIVAGNDDRMAYVAPLTEWASVKRGEQTCYTTSLYMPLSWLNRQVLLSVGYSCDAFEVVVNDKRVGYTPDGTSATEFNITKYIHTGDNDIAIIQHNDAKVNTIYRSARRGIADVKALCQPTIRVRDIVHEVTLNDAGEGLAEFGIIVKCDALNPKRAKFEYALRLRDSIVVAEGAEEITLDMRREDTLRFFARVPKAAMWSATNPELLQIDITNRIDGKAAERISRKVGLRVAEWSANLMYINGKPTKLYATDYSPALKLDELSRTGHNALIITRGDVPESIYDECDRLGVYVISACAIDTSSLGNTISRGGNPSNNPSWHDTYILRNLNNRDIAKTHPSVIGYMLGRGTTTGINIYESFLYMKSLETRLPIIYEGANGEWCSDKIKIR